MNSWSHRRSLCWSWLRNSYQWRPRLYHYGLSRMPGNPGSRNLHQTSGRMRWLGNVHVWNDHSRGSRHWMASRCHDGNDRDRRCGGCQLLQKCVGRNHRGASSSCWHWRLWLLLGRWVWYAAHNCLYGCRIGILSSDIGQVCPQRSIPSIQLLVFCRQCYYRPLKLFDHGFFPLSRFSSADTVLFQTFLSLVFLQIVVSFYRR